MTGSPKKLHGLPFGFKFFFAAAIIYFGDELTDM
jgi:hypothetical protein